MSEKIFILLIEKKWDEVIDSVREDPSLASKRIDSSGADSIVNHESNKVSVLSGYLPLHVALANGAPLAVIDVLLEAYPTAAKMTTKHGVLPVHYAAAGLSVEILKALQSRYPAGAAGKDSEGNIALHYAAICNAPIEVFVTLLEAYLEGCLSKNSDGEIPIEVYFLKNKDSRNVEVVNLLLDSAWQCLGGTVHNK